MKIVTITDWFDKKTEEFIDSEEIQDITTTQLLEILGVEYDPLDPELLAGDYDLDEIRLNRLQPFMKHKYDLSKYIYFIGKRSDD